MSNGGPPARPKPETSHTWINGVPEQPEPNMTVIGAPPDRWEPVINAGLGAVMVMLLLVILLGLGVLGLELLAELLQMVGIGGGG